VRELKRLEKHIVDIGLRGWVAAVDLDSPHVMRWAARVGARPFELNVAESRLWFVKNLDQGGWENV
jgi:glutathione S-transferase